jgi:hypothetical protein
MQARLVAALASAAVLCVAAATPASAQPTTTAPMTAPTTVPATTATKVPALSPTTSAPAAGGAITNTAPPMAMTMAPMPMGTLAIDARGLRARRTAAGFTLSGQGLVKDACQSARFDFFPGNIFPPQFNLNQFRNPKMMGVMCIARLRWVPAAPRDVRATKGQKTVTVHTQKRPSIVVPIQ